MILSELEAVIASSAVSGGLSQLISEKLPLDSQITHLDTSATRHEMYLLEQKGEQFIVRVEPQLDSLPGVDPRRERTILDAIAPFYWSPKLLINEPQQGILIMHHAGECCEALQSSQKADVLEVVNEMQTVSDLPSLDYAGLLDQYRAELKDSGHLQLIDETELQLNALPELQRVLVHHDLHSGNICWQNGAPTLIDWEYAGVGVAWLDYAVLTRDLGFSAKELMELPLLKGFTEPELIHFLAQSIQVIDQLEMLWSHYKSQVTG